MEHNGGEAPSQRASHDSSLPSIDESTVGLLSNTEQEKDPATTTITIHPLKKGNRIPFLATIFLALLVPLGLLLYNTLPKPATQPAASATAGAEFGACGATIAEARALGCVFDILSFAWVRPECLYADLLADYRNRSSIAYYRSPSFAPADRIPDEEVYRGDWLHTYADKEQHPVHCMYILAKLNLALAEHRPIDSRALDLVHTRHCGMVLLDGWLHEMEGCWEGGCEHTRTNALFTSCGFA